jgi:NAD(P)-dependent dehydrogenase (short-subunit alcohol dehydrogenase family)
MSFLSEGVAVVTGAGSGIGRALARQLAAAGSALALADVDEAGLLQTAQSLEKKTAAVTTHVVDVADEEAVRSFAQEVSNRHGRVTLLINNAGIALHGNFEELSLDDFRFLMNINFWGTVYGVKFFFPVLKRRDSALTRPASLRCADSRRRCATNSRAATSASLACIPAGFERRSRATRASGPVLQPRDIRRRLPSLRSFFGLLLRRPRRAFCAAWNAASRGF